MKINGESLTLFNIIGAIRHAHWLASYIKSTRMSHRPFYHNTTVVICVYLIARYVKQVHILKERKKKIEESPPPSLPRSTASPSWNLTWPEMARLSYCRDVTVLLGGLFRFGAITTSHSRMLARYASFFSVNSTASLWDLRLWRQWGEGMWACVRIEPAGFNVVRNRALCNSLLLFFYRCLHLVKIQRHMGDDIWQHYWPTRPNDLKTGDAEQSFDSGWSLLFSELFYLYKMLR